MIINPNQIGKIVDSIERGAGLYIANFLGKEYLNSDQRSLIRNAEIEYREWGDLIFSQHILGQLSQIIGNTAAQKVSLNDLSSFIKQEGYLKLGEEERFLIDLTKRQVVRDINKLSNTIEENLNQHVLTEGAIQGRIAEEAARSLSNRQSVMSIANKLSEELAGYQRDFARSVEYNSHQALSNGQAQTIRKLFGDDPIVYKQTFGGVCNVCNRLYNEGGKPKLYRLSELEANGTNIGVKQQNWKPVVGSTHVGCRCLLKRYQGPRAEQPKIERPLVKIVFNNETYKA